MTGGSTISRNYSRLFCLYFLFTVLVILPQVNGRCGNDYFRFVNGDIFGGNRSDSVPTTATGFGRVNGWVRRAAGKCRENKHRLFTDWQGNRQGLCFLPRCLFASRKLAPLALPLVGHATWAEDWAGSTRPALPTPTASYSNTTASYSNTHRFPQQHTQFPTATHTASCSNTRSSSK